MTKPWFLYLILLIVMFSGCTEKTGPITPNQTQVSPTGLPPTGTPHPRVRSRLRAWIRETRLLLSSKNPQYSLLAARMKRAALQGGWTKMLPHVFNK